jgi:hypothetical protein
MIKISHQAWTLTTLAPWGYSLSQGFQVNGLFITCGLYLERVFLTESSYKLLEYKLCHLLASQTYWKIGESSKDSSLCLPSSSWRESLAPIIKKSHTPFPGEYTLAKPRKTMHPHWGWEGVIPTGVGSTSEALVGRAPSEHAQKQPSISVPLCISLCPMPRIVSNVLQTFSKELSNEWISYSHTCLL